MKKFLNLMLISGFLFMTVAANAQFRKIPGAVTDAFKVKYPSAQTVSWEDKVSAFQASFVIDGETYSARYTSKAEWLGSQKKIQEDKLPSAVKDGLAKSKYADWEVKTGTAHYLPDRHTQSTIIAHKYSLKNNNPLS